MAGDNSPGCCCIWAITIFLFVSILAGGIFLALYMIRPDSPSSSWYPIIGITLVCLPWVFWFFTCFYRILSRKFGFRMVCWGENVYSAKSIREEGVCVSETNVNDNLEDQNTSKMSYNDNSHTRCSSKNSKQVHFGETVVVTEGNNSNPSLDGQIPSHSRDSSESEVPLKMCMAP